MEGLGQETAPFGIKTLLIEPGRFRTKLLSSGNMKSVQSAIADYKDSSREKFEALAKEDQAQPGDPKMLAKITLDLVRGEGVAQGKEVPFRLPLGTDCYDDVKQKCQETLKLLEEWGPIIKSTEFE